MDYYEQEKRDMGGGRYKAGFAMALKKAFPRNADLALRGYCMICGVLLIEKFEGPRDIVSLKVFCKACRNRSKGGGK